MQIIVLTVLKNILGPGGKMNVLYIKLCFYRHKISPAHRYKNCFLMNLNGLNLNSKSTASWEGIIYNSWKGETHSLKSVKILIKAN